MTGPLCILAVLALLGGALGLPAVTHLPHALEEWLLPVLGSGTQRFAENANRADPMSAALEWSLLGVGAAIALLFAHRGFHTCESGPAFDEGFERVQPAAAKFLVDAWGLDRFYERCVVQPVALIAFAIAVVVDQFAIDGLVDGSASLARSAAARVRSMASGRISDYGLWMGAAAAAIAIFLLVRGS